MRERVLLPRRAIKTAVMDETCLDRVKVWLGNGMPNISNIHVYSSGMYFTY